MAEKRKNRKDKKEVHVATDPDKPSKQEYEVAKYLRHNLPEKRTTLLGHKVDYFISSKAIDALLDSKFATGPSPLFTDRDSVLDFLNGMLVHKLFHRAQKVIVVPKEDKKKGKKSKSDAENSAAEDKKKPEKKEKVRKKVKLDMHLQQIMVDANEPYVWIYDPIPLKTWIIGFAMVIGAILVCLFPLWPRVVRTYVYYLSVAAAGFLFFIIGLAVLRFIVFCIVWGLTMGKHHFWILPNLTEDVGFWASFWPLYLHEYGGTTDSSESKESSPSKKKKSPEKEPLLDDKEEDKEEGSSVDEDSASAANPNDHYGTNSSENGFEILDTQDLDVESSHPKSS